MVNVAYIVSKINKGGPINQLFYLCKYIDLQQTSIMIITLSPRNNPNTYHDIFKDMGIEVIDLSLNKVLSVSKGIKIINSLVKNRNINIVQSFGFRADFIASQLRSVYKITSIRNRILFNYRIIYGFLPGTIFCYLNLVFIKRFDKIVSCSQSVSKHLEKVGIKSQVIVNAVDKSVFPLEIDLYDKLEVRKFLKLPSDKNIFLTVSSNLPGKNVEFLINAFIKNEDLSKDILIVAGYVTPDLSEKYRYRPNVNFIGKVYNIFEYYKASDFFISASVSEGMPNAVLEAMSLGCPVILSDIDPHIEIINSVNYSVGSIFKNNDIDDLLRSIAEIKNKDYTIISKNSEQCTRDVFRADLMAKKYQELYNSLKYKNKRT